MSPRFYLRHVRQTNTTSIPCDLNSLGDKIVVDIRMNEKQGSLCNGVGSLNYRRLYWDSLPDLLLTESETEELYGSFHTPSYSGYVLIEGCRF